jgi:preprotein translocase subunit YajC
MFKFPVFFAEAPAADLGQGLQQTIMLVALAVIFFYFIIWRPEQKRRKEMEAKRKAMKKGDKVVVAGGILGEVYKIQTDTIIIKLSDGAKMEVMKGALQDLQPSTGPEQPEEPKTKE